MKKLFLVDSSNDQIVTAELIKDGAFVYMDIWTWGTGTAKLTVTSMDGTNIKKTFTVKVVEP